MVAFRLGDSGSGITHDAWMRVARFALWLTGLAVGGWLLVLALTDASAEGAGPLAVAPVVLGCSFLFSGLVAWRHRPDQRLGRLMVVLGAVWLAGLSAEQSQSGILATLGMFLVESWVLLLVFFLVSFPSGRLASRTDRLLVAPFALNAVPLQRRHRPGRLGPARAR